MAILGRRRAELGFQGGNVLLRIGNRFGSADAAARRHDDVAARQGDEGHGRPGPRRDIGNSRHVGCHEHVADLQGAVDAAAQGIDGNDDGRIAFFGGLAQAALDKGGLAAVDVTGNRQDADGIGLHDSSRCGSCQRKE